MEKHGFESSGGDLTASSDPSGSWMESLSIRRRRLASPSPSAFLAPAFDACAAATPRSSSASSGSCGSGGSLDLDPSLLRYTRSQPHFSPSDSSDLQSTSTRRRLRRLLQLRSSLSSLPSPSTKGPCSSISPLPPINNLPPAVYIPPLKLEVGEDVVVMDGVLVSDAGSTNGRILYKTDVCHAWDGNGICRYGSKCQFAHGKEDLRSARPMKQKSELPARHSGGSRSPFCSVPSSTSSSAFDAAAPGGTNRNGAQPAAMNTLLTGEADCKQLAIPSLSPPSSLEPQRSPNQAVAEAGGTTWNGAPPGTVKTLSIAEADDKTYLSPPTSAEPLFQWPPTEAEDAQITKILYGPSSRRRLPVFTEFCPDISEDTPEENVGVLNANPRPGTSVGTRELEMKKFCTEDHLKTIKM